MHLMKKPMQTSCKSTVKTKPIEWEKHTHIDTCKLIRVHLMLLRNDVLGYANLTAMVLKYQLLKCKIDLLHSMLILLVQQRFRVNVNMFANTFRYLRSRKAPEKIITTTTTNLLSKHSFSMELYKILIINLIWKWKSLTTTENKRFYANIAASYSN